MKRLATAALLVCVLMGVALPGAAQTDPPEGIEKIAFIAWHDDDDTYSVDVVDPDGSDHATLVIGRIVWSPAWSPDGSTLAFLGKVSTGARARIYLIDSDGANLRAVDLPTPLSMFPGTVAWSPDGAHLIYGTSSGMDIRFFRLDLETGEAERIRFPDIASFHQVWIALSPDGGSLAVWTHELDAFDNQLYVTDAAGENAVAFPGEAPDGNSYDHLVWSPDGQRVALYIISGEGQQPQHSLAVANADGSGLDVILNNSPVGIASASWSPDSERIVFWGVEMNSVFIPPGELFVVDADGSNLRSLNIDGDAMPNGTSWGVLPAGTVIPSEPILLENAAR